MKTYSKKIIMAIIDDYFHEPKYNAQILNVNCNKFPSPLSHGDKVHGTICKYLTAPDNVRFTLYGIYDGKGNSSIYIIQCLEQLLMRCRPDIVVLCLSFHNSDNRGKLAVIASRFPDVAILMAESKTNGNAPGRNRVAMLPQPAMIYVERGVFKHPDCLIVTEADSQTGISVICDTLPEIIRSGHEYFVFSGNSKGTAILAAILANLIAGKITANHLLSELSKKSVAVTYNYIDRPPDGRHYTCLKEYYQVMTDVTGKVLGQKAGEENLRQWLGYNLFKIFGNEEKYLTFIFLLLKHYQVQIAPDRIMPFDIWHMNNLGRWIEGLV